MNTLTFPKNRVSGALLSACLAGGVAWSATANAASNNSETDKHYAEAKVHQKSKHAEDNATSRQQPSASQDTGDGRAPPFNQVDQNRSTTLVWRELRAIYDAELDDVGWNEEYVLKTYDRDQDEALNEDEYVTFVSGLMTEMIKHANPPTEDDPMAEMHGDHPTPETVIDRNLSTPASGDDSQERREAATSTEDLKDVTELSDKELEEREVINSTGDDLGTVERVVSAPDGSITGLVVGVGGFWDIGNKNIFVPADEVHVAGDYIVWQTDLDEQALEAIPHYQLEEHPSLAP